MNNTNGSIIRLTLARDKESCSSGVLLSIDVEDDGHWLRKLSIDSYHLPELLAACQAATRARLTMPIDWPAREQRDGSIVPDQPTQTVWSSL